jgi:hypothetical protein
VSPSYGVFVLLAFCGTEFAVSALRISAFLLLFLALLVYVFGFVVVVFTKAL